MKTSFPEAFTSSASVYGPGGPFDETSPCRPMRPYSESKLTVEGLVLGVGDRIRVTFGSTPGPERARVRD